MCVKLHTISHTIFELYRSQELYMLLYMLLYIFAIRGLAKLKSLRIVMKVNL